MRDNRTMSDFKYLAYGGVRGNTNANNGGAGTTFIYHMVHEHRTLIVDNNGHKCSDELNIISNYANLPNNDGCRTWILPDSQGIL